VTDRREEILTQMQAVLETVPSVAGVWRNRGVLPRLAAPAIILLDGSERRQTAMRPGSGVQMAPAIFTLKPQVAIVLPQRDTVQNTELNGAALPVGPALSAYRALIVPAILEDQDLINLCSSGQITYDGYETDMKTGEEIGAFGSFMIFLFSLSYVMDPSTLTAPTAIAAARSEIAAYFGGLTRGR
jgi:hypothetical protein